MRQLGDWLALERDEVAMTVLPWSYPPSLLFSLRYLLSGVPNVLVPRRRRTRIQILIFLPEQEQKSAKSPS